MSFMLVLIGDVHRVCAWLPSRPTSYRNPKHYKQTQNKHDSPKHNHRAETKAGSPPLRDTCFVPKNAFHSSMIYFALGDLGRFPDSLVKSTLWVRTKSPAVYVFLQLIAVSSLRVVQSHRDGATLKSVR